MDDKTPNLQNYATLLASIKERIQTVQVRAALAVNRELVMLYWNIGKEILSRQNEEGWGKGIIPRLAKDLKSQFPEMQGLSPRNLGYMKAFAEAWPEEAILQQAAAKLPWFHNCIILDKIKSREERLWYMDSAIAHGWSRNVLEIHIETGLYRRQGKSANNFSRTLPSPQSDLAREIIKDPYNFDFLTLSQDVHEREIEEGLLAHLRRFLIELGTGFAFVGCSASITFSGQRQLFLPVFLMLNVRRRWPVR